MSTWVNWGCGTHRAPEPWINVDVVENATTRPDVIVDPDAPFAPWPNHTVERLFAGHVLEHIPWPQLPAALGHARNALAPDGEMLVVGPDALRTIDRWRRGLEPLWLVESVLEHDEECAFGGGDWPGARHWWNCHEARVVRALTVCGFTDVQALGAPPDGWPVVGWAEWQFCVTARA